MPRSARRAPRLVAITAAALAPACATSLSTFQPAHVAPQGHVQAAAGQDISLPTGTISRAIDAGETLAKAADERSLTEEERLALLEAGLHLALDPPAFVSHAGAAYTVLPRFEIGLRYASGAWRLGGRYQLLRQEEGGTDLTIGVGVQRFTYEFPLQDVLDYVRLEDFERWSVDVPILFGTHSDYHRLWGGPKFVFSTFDAGLDQRLPNLPRLTAKGDGRSLYVGAQGGVALGYRYLFVGAELTVARVFANANLVTSGGERRDVDIGGWIVYPGLAVMGEF